MNATQFARMVDHHGLYKIMMMEVMALSKRVRVSLYLVVLDHLGFISMTI